MLERGVSHVLQLGVWGETMGGRPRHGRHGGGADGVERSEAADKRRQTMERIRRETVLEITLEPIEGLNEADYELALSDTSTSGQQVVEATAARFYAEVAPKINVRQAQRALERAGKEHQELAG